MTMRTLFFCILAGGLTASTCLGFGFWAFFLGGGSVFLPYFLWAAWPCVRLGAVHIPTVDQAEGAALVFMVGGAFAYACGAALARPPATWIITGCLHAAVICLAAYVFSGRMPVVVASGAVVASFVLSYMIWSIESAQAWLGAGGCLVAYIGVQAFLGGLFCFLACGGENARMSSVTRREIAAAGLRALLGLLPWIARLVASRSMLP